jgi:DNA-binding transcriptional LysR family regulator
MTAPVLDPDLLRAFVAVAEHRSFTRAGAVLNRTQSTVSMQIKRLEERLGVRLFHRGPAVVGPTAAGEAFLGYARRILDLGEEALARLATHKVEGRVRLGVMDDYGAAVLPRLLADFAVRHPQVLVEMRTGLTATMAAQLGEIFDLAIVMHPEGAGQGLFLRREQAVWAAGPAHAAERADPLPLALYPQGCLFRQWAMEALDAAGRPWRLAFVSQSSDAVVQAAAEGLGVTVVKDGVFPSRLRRLSPADGLPALPCTELRLHRAADLSPAAERLADHLAASLAEAA